MVRLGLWRALWALLALASAVAAHAQLTIEITRGVEGALPIAVTPFAGGGQFGPERDIAAIVAADLKRSGRFEPFQQGPAVATLDDVDYELWRQRSLDYLVVGQLSSVGENVAARFQLADVFQGKQLLGLNFTVPPADLRRLAHHIADLIYQQLTGERGAFNTRIAYVTVVGEGRAARYSLMIADADGYAPRAVLRSPEPLLSPAWSPDGRRLAYVSFESRRAQVIVQDLFSGTRRTVSADQGINGAPAWSPDGGRLALTLSRDGNPEIYIKDLNGGGLTRLTNNRAIDTEPVWSPDGGRLVFTSDRGGGPQLYSIAAGGGQPRRLTFDGGYNARASFAPDGDRLVLVHRYQGRFVIGLMDSDGGTITRLTDGALDESPSFAPNGQMIIYAASDAGQAVLAAVSADGRVKQRLRLQGGQVREPSWSPYTR